MGDIPDPALGPVDDELRDVIARADSPVIRDLQDLVCPCLFPPATPGLNNDILLFVSVTLHLVKYFTFLSAVRAVYII